MAGPNGNFISFRFSNISLSNPCSCESILVSSSILLKCVRISVYSKLCDWYYIYPITIFLNCALIIISHNNKIITL